MLRRCQPTSRILDACSTLWHIRLQSENVARGSGERLPNRTAQDTLTPGVPVWQRPTSKMSDNGERQAPTMPSGTSSRTRSDHRKSQESNMDKRNSVTRTSSQYQHRPSLRSEPSGASLKNGAEVDYKNADALTNISNFLSSSNMSSIHPLKISATTLRSMYKTVKNRTQLHHLTSKQLTEIISLFGSLSIPTPRPRCIYFNDFVSHMEEPSHATYWPFILEIAQDKEKLGQSLTGTDRYWVMRAQLSKVVATENELRSGDPKLRALSQAAAQYLRIWRHTSDPEIHIPYFQVLLSLRSPQHISNLVKRLCMVLDIHANPHSRFIDLLWQILLKHGGDLSFELKERLLLTVSTRLSKFSSVASQSRTGSRPSAIKVYDEVSKRHRQAILGIPELSSALTTALFPCYSTVRIPSEIRQWASDQAVRAFAPTVPLEARWGNFLLLAISKLPEIPSQGSAPATMEGPNISTASWRTVFVFTVLEQTLTSLPSSRPPDEIKNIVRSTWRLWKAAYTDDPHQRLTVSRIIVAAFFRFSSRAIDEPLKDGCFRFSVTHGLLASSNDDTNAERLHTIDAIVAYVLASVSCGTRDWHDIFLGLNEVLPGTEWRVKVVEALLWHYIPRDIEGAYELYLYGRNNHLLLSAKIVHTMSVALVSPHTLDIVAPFLQDPRFSRNQVEELLGAILRIFQVERREYADPALAKRLGDVMWQLYADTPPLKKLKYPVRFFFSIMIASGQPSKAVDIVQAIHSKTPSFFTTRLFLRLILVLVRYRQFHLSIHLLRLVPSSPPRALDDVRRKLTLALARAGAAGLARQVYQTGPPHNVRRSTRESLTRVVGFRPWAPARLRALQVLPTLARNPTHGSSIRYAVLILINARRSLAARKLYERTHQSMNPVTKTSIGNIILHGPLLRPEICNGRLVRNVLRTKEILEKNYGFVPDRTTTNIILKAILRWRIVIDPPKLKALFDHMVRSGYPASQRWRRDHGVPFGTPLSHPHSFNLPILPSFISFEKHVRPMYKMFIKAFYLRLDVRAAKTVVGILKEEGAAAMHRREERNKARRLGLVRKHAREREKRKA